MLRTVLAALLLAAVVSTASAAPRGLDIYFVDTEGGAATLLVTPAGETVLVDCGSPGDRDAERIARAVRDAGAKGIDHLVITHYHSDHVGGVPDLGKRLPVRRYYDKGAPVLEGDLAWSADMVRAYQARTGGRSHVLAAGDTIALKGPRGARDVKLRFVCGEGRTAGGGRPNPGVLPQQPRPQDTTDNARSLGFVAEYGPFRFLCLGDITWNVEYALVSPHDQLGQVDLYQVTHHGLSQSNHPALLRAAAPRVAVFSNGTRKGCDPEVVEALRALPEAPAQYQVHRNLATGALNAPAEFIANETADCRGEYIKVSVAADGRSYTVQIGPTGKRTTYRTRAR